MWVVSVDGDDCGSRIGRAILSNQLNELHEISDRIKLGNEVVERWSANHGGKTISSGGDQGTFEVPHEALEMLEQLMRDYQFVSGLTMSVGVGKTLSESGKALLAAKFRGKNRIVYYDFSVENDLEKAKNHLSQGIATEVEQKQGEAYLQPKTQDMTVDNKFKAIKKDVGATSAPMYDSEDPPMDEIVSSEEGHSCPYCQELQNQNITDEECPYCVAPEMHDPNAEGHADDCPYCAVMNHDPEAEGHTDDCPYCQEMAIHDPMMDGHADDCPYCARSHDPDQEGHPDDCKYCARAGDQAGGDDQTIVEDPPSTDILPTTQDSQNYAGQDLARPSLDKPAAISMMPSRPAMITDSKTNQNVLLENEQGPPALQEYDDFTAGSMPGTTSTPEDSETMENIRDEIDELRPDQIPLREEGQVDDVNIPSDDTMEDNVSRPGSYDQDVPSDLGTGENPVNGHQGVDNPDDPNSPNIASVLQEGLDHHADSIKREKVIEMVGEALEGFKASKMIIERAKTEAPLLYTSSIAMLRAMIEMCKMLGLGGESVNNAGETVESPDIQSPQESVLEGQMDTASHGMPDTETNDPYAQDEIESDGHPDYDNLFPAHPESGGGPGSPKRIG